MIKEAFPLQFPKGWERTKFPKRSRFGDYNKKPSISKSTDKLQKEMKLMGGSDLIISSNLRLRKDGLPYSVQRQPDDCGIAVYFMWDGEQKVVACDSYDLCGCNLWAIAKTIEAMRGIDRWGCSEILNRAFTGFTAIPERVESNTCWDILGISKDANEIEAKKAYRLKAKQHHPDINEESDSFIIVQNAYEEVMKFLSSKQQEKQVL